MTEAYPAVNFLGRKDIAANFPAAPGKLTLEAVRCLPTMGSTAACLRKEAAKLKGLIASKMAPPRTTLAGTAASVVPAASTEASVGAPPFQ